MVESNWPSKTYILAFKKKMMIKIQEKRRSKKINKYIQKRTEKLQKQNSFPLLCTRKSELHWPDPHMGK